MVFEDMEKMWRRQRKQRIEDETYLQAANRVEIFNEPPRKVYEELKIKTDKASDSDEREAIEEAIRRFARNFL